MSGWSDIALRARATTPISSAVMYKAHTVLTRGRSTLEKGFLWVKGQGESVIRYVHAPAYNAHAAHMVSGWQQNDAKAVSMLLGVYDLPAYMGHRPHFWPVSVQGYENMPDSATGTAAIAFWRDICSSLCYRWHDDDVEMMQVDLRPGVYEGDWTNARPSKCHCYAYDDLAKLNYTGQASEISHEAPNDMAMARFLSTAKLVNNYVGTGTRPSDGVTIPDEGERYRRFINTYAVHRDPWESYFVVEEQASVFHRLALEPGYFFEPETTMATEAYRSVSNVADTNACVRECVVIGGAGPLDPVPKNRMSFATMGFIEGETGPNCWCFAKDLLHPDHDHLIVHDPTRLQIKMYRTKLCVGVSGGSERSVVYRKGVMGANAVCLGMPVGVGMILANGSVFLSRDAADDTRPIDVQCRSACDANPDCALAHSFVSTPLEHLTQYTLAYTHQTCTPPLLRRWKHFRWRRWRTPFHLHRSRQRRPRHHLRAFHLFLRSHPRRHQMGSLACEHGLRRITILHPRAPTTGVTHSSTCTAALVSRAAKAKGSARPSTSRPRSSPSSTRPAT